MIGRMDQFREVDEPAAEVRTGFDFHCHCMDRLPGDDEAAGFEVAQNEIDGQVDFAFEPSSIADPPVAPRRRAWLAPSTVIAWLLSMAAHGAMAAAAVWVAHAVALGPARSAERTPPVAYFAYGDTSPKLGLKTREGQEDLPPGFDGLPTALPPASSAPPWSLAPTEPQAEPRPEPLPEFSAAPSPIDPAILADPQDQPPAQFLPPVEQSLADLPAFKPRKLNLPPAEAEPTAVADNAAAATPPPTTAGSGTMSTSTAAGSIESTNLPAGSGDQTPGGQGGAATGIGGLAATGVPGIRAGLREGQHIRPVYPIECRRRGEEGVVYLDVEVLADGRVGQITVVDDAGHPLLADAAVRAFRGEVLLPALENGRPVRDVRRFPIAYSIKDAKRRS